MSKITVIPNRDLSLNFKPEDTIYKFVEGKSAEITELAFDYLGKMYPNTFKRVVPIVNTIENKIAL